MRYAVMQILTWGTVAGAIACALLLASADSGPMPNLSVSATSLDHLLPGARAPVGSGVAPPVRRVASAPSGASPSR